MIKLREFKWESKCPEGKSCQIKGARKKTLWNKGLVEKRPCGKKVRSVFENWKKGLVKKNLVRFFF